MNENINIERTKGSITLEQSSKKPVTSAYEGNVIVQVWENPIKNKDGTVTIKPSFTIQKMYKKDDVDATWSYTSSIDKNGIFKVQRAIEKALNKYDLILDSRK